MASIPTWTLHATNHLHQGNGVKVGGHSAFSASLATVMTALYGAVLRPEASVIVKPPASLGIHAPATPVRTADSRYAYAEGRGIGACGFR